ncbi:flagellar hook-length control protein FliK [Defluviitalea phaphyphila]|uniref:flagellar hook-length control protein FliK n=1 Tax=Defluviitalea phaphyphila TaxID=1473580 RepID=UPI0007312FE5|nr:flagellar hook-length control protein FliK [Defluviitalea phaphyphila]
MNLTTLNFSSIQTNLSIQSADKEIYSNKSNSNNQFEETLQKVQNQSQKYENKNDIKSNQISQKNEDIKTNLIKKDSNNLEEEKTEIEEQSKIPSEEEIILLLEQKTDLSMENIEETLNELGFTVYDLFSVQNLQQFMKKIQGVDNVIDLLSIPEAVETYKNIMNILNEIKEEIPNIENIISKNNLSNTTDIVKDINSNKDTLINNFHNDGLNLSEEKVGNKEILTENFSQEESSKKEILEKEFSQQKISTNKDNNMSEVEVKEIIVETIDNNNGNIINQNIIYENKIIKTELSQISSESVQQPQQIIEQMVEYIKVNLAEDITEINLNLKPDYLGKLSLKIVSEKGIMTARFIAENQVVKEVIETNLNQLRDVLEDQGIKVDKLEVFVKQEFDGQGFNFNQEKFSKSNKRISSIIANLDETIEEIYDDVETKNPYIFSENKIDFLA